MSELSGKGILLDTSFFIRLLNLNDVLHTTAVSFYKHFLDSGAELHCSTISLAEYCVRGTIDQLPLRNLRILPFNFDHATEAGIFARLIFDSRGDLGIADRLVIPNDTKLFSQAHVEQGVSYFATSDAKCLKMLQFLKTKRQIDIEAISIRTPLHEFLGELPFSEP